MIEKVKSREVTVITFPTTAIHLQTVPLNICSPLSLSIPLRLFQFFQSFFPRFSDLPPAAYVYAQLRFVLKFQFKVSIFNSISGKSKIPSIDKMSSCSPLELPHVPLYFENRDKKHGVPIMSFANREPNQY